MRDPLSAPAAQWTGMNRTDSDRRLYETFVRSHARDLYRFAFRLCGRAELAEDLLQETFCEAWRSMGSLRDVHRSRAWLFQILRHRFAHSMRDGRRHPRTVMNIEDLESAASRPEPDLLSRMASQELLQMALDALDDRFKEPLLMVFMQGFTCREAAELLDVPLGTVLSRIHRARKFLRRFLIEHDEDTRYEFA